MNHLLKVMLFTSLVSGQVHAGGWSGDAMNNPFPLINTQNHRAVTKIMELPAHGEMDRVPWTDSYWPRNKFATSQRYQENPAQPVTFVRIENNKKTLIKNGKDLKDTFKVEELKSMSKSDLDKLSPAEKFCIANCDYSFRHHKNELSSNSTSNDAWEGNCNGWSAAALSLEEPGICDYTNSDGINITWGSGDIKAMVGFLFGRTGINSTATQCGRRNLGFNNFFRGLVGKEIGINPGSFHLILSNLLGLQGRGLVFDVDPSKQVWNHPIYKFNSTMHPIHSAITDKAEKGTVREFAVSTDVFFVIEQRAPSVHPQIVKGNPGFKVQSLDRDTPEHGFIFKKTYTYILEVNNQGEIIGGRWTGASIQDHPDFAWVQPKPEFAGPFKVVGEIYQKSLQNKSSSAGLKPQE
jgi:hypothetical protein